MTAWRNATERLITYTEVLQVIHRELVAEEVQQSILQHAAVAIAVWIEEALEAVLDCLGKRGKPPGRCGVNLASALLCNINMVRHTKERNDHG